MISTILLLGWLGPITVPATVCSLRAAVSQITEAPPSAVSVDDSGAHMAFLVRLDDVPRPDALAAISRASDETVTVQAESVQVRTLIPVQRAESDWRSGVARELVRQSVERARLSHRAGELKAEYHQSVLAGAPELYPPELGPLSSVPSVAYASENPAFLALAQMTADTGDPYERALNTVTTGSAIKKLVPTDGAYTNTLRLLFGAEQKDPKDGSVLYWGGLLNVDEDGVGLYDVAQTYAGPAMDYLFETCVAEQLPMNGPSLSSNSVSEGVAEQRHLVTALFAGEGPVGPMPGHTSLDSNASKFYEASLRTTQTVAASGALDDDLTDFKKPKITSLSQVMEIWAARHKLSVVMALAPLREDVEWLTTLPSGRTATRLADLFCPQSPWGIEKLGEHTYIVRNRLAFLDRAWKFPMDALLAAEKALGSNELREAWRSEPTNGPGVFYLPQSVAFAFLDSIAMDDQLWPLATVPFRLRYRGLPLRSLATGVIQSALWKYRTSSIKFPTQDDLLKIDSSSVPDDVWNRVKTALYPGRDCLRLCEPGNTTKTAVSVALCDEHFGVRTPDRNGEIYSVEIRIEGPAGGWSERYRAGFTSE